jgi:hypothetical protein
MPALIQQFFGDFKMRGGGSDDVQRVAGGGGFGDGIENPGLVFSAILRAVSACASKTPVSSTKSGLLQF